MHFLSSDLSSWQDKSPSQKAYKSFKYAPPICTTNHQIFPFKLDRPDFNVADTLYSRFLLALVVLQCRLGNISQRHRPIEQKSTCRLLFKKFHPECRCIFADHYSCYAPPLLLLYTIKSNCRLFVFLPSTLVQTPKVGGDHIFSSRREVM